MRNKNGFTVIELIVVVIIVGLISAYALVQFAQSMEQSKAQAAKNNLLGIAAAQQKYFEDTGAYCTGSCTTTAAINTNLLLSITDTVNYACAALGSNYSCTWNDGTDTLTLSVNGAGTGYNVACVSASNNCPS